MDSKYIIMTEAALDAMLVGDALSPSTIWPIEGAGIYKFELGAFVGYRVQTEPDNAVLTLVGVEWLEILQTQGGRPSEIYRRIARVVKGMRSSPIHLPRHWFEYHSKNFLAFFALPREISSARWIVEFGKASRAARFDYLTSSDEEVNLSSFSPSDWPSGFEDAAASLLAAILLSQPESTAQIALSPEVDLEAIGSGSIVEGRRYEEWLHLLTPSQSGLLAHPAGTSVRIVGPAGSGKTLSLCMMALKLSRQEKVIATGEKILVATHSWAMSERIDGVLKVLNSGVPPQGITVFPLLSLLELHAGHIGHRKTDVIGDDSTDGRLKSLEIIKDVLELVSAEQHSGVSGWIVDAIKSPAESRLRLELVVTLYEEMSGILTASGVAPDDHEAIREYINSKREDWMPPFPSVGDRVLVISVYKKFVQQLIDRSSITTDQFIIDSIRVLETFTWRMRKETEGYDYIFVDELQLFDPQERAALELLGRQRKGVPFITAEDPSQGVFSTLNSTLNSRRDGLSNSPVYLETVHRFNREIFDFIAFIYQKFPLNALPLKIDEQKSSGKAKPHLYNCESVDAAISKSVSLVDDFYKSGSEGQRICVVTLGDIDAEVVAGLTELRLPVTRLSSFDDVERLSYTKKTVVVAPWEFVGGTQFSHVIVLAFGIAEPTSQFGRLREMISIYLSCSRAADALSLVVSGYTPTIVAEACDNGLVIRSDQ